MDINALTGGQQPVTAVRSTVVSSTMTVGANFKPLVSPTDKRASTEQERQPVEEAITSIKQFAQSIQRNLNFSLDDSTGRVVVKVTDSVSGDVIRQIPSEDALRLAESLEEARSLLFKAEA